MTDDNQRSATKPAWLEKLQQQENNEPDPVVEKIKIAHEKMLTELIEGVKYTTDGKQH